METNSPAQQNFVWHSNASDSSFSVEFIKAPNLDLILLGAELFQAMEEHDRLVLHFKGKPFEGNTVLISGDPVKFTFRSGKVESNFYGYIHTVHQVNGIDGGNTDVVCVSSSYLLKDTSQKIYRQVTADQVVSRIAAKYSMEAITQRHPRIKESIVQAGQSDWQLLRRLAKQTGFALRTENTTIFFVSKAKLFQSKKDSAAYFKYIDAPAGGVIVPAERMLGTILNFTPVISDESPELGIRVDRVITGTSNTTGESINVTHAMPTQTTAKSLGAVIPGEGYFQ